MERFSLNKIDKIKFRISVLCVLFLIATSGFSQNGIFNIVEFGAVNGGKIIATKAIQNAIDKCAENGGGKVIVPAGKYLTGPLFLKSNITFEVFSGAELIFSDDIENCQIVDGRW